MKILHKGRRLLGRLRPRTLRLRITLVAGIVLTILVVAGLGITYAALVYTVKRTIDGQLVTYAEQIAQAGQNGTWPDPLPPSPLDGNANAQVLDTDGHVLAASRELAGVPAVFELSPDQDELVRQAAAGRDVISSDVRAKAYPAVVAGQQVVIITGTSTDVLDQLVDASPEPLLYGVPVLLVLASGAVWLIVGRTLRPVERIRRATTEITGADLARRVPEPRTRDEVGALAHTMNDMLDRLEDAAVRQRRFVSDASHELRSPLTAIRTSLEVGLAHSDRAPWPDIAGRAVAQTVRLEELIQQLLLLARSDDHELMAVRQDVDLAEVLGEIEATTAHHGKLSVDVPPGITVHGNPGHLSRMFRNVTDNGLRYAASRVTVAAEPTPTGVRVEITDDGPGIPLAER
jgi:signal transduction histidine kinase